MLLIKNFLASSILSGLNLSLYILPHFSQRSELENFNTALNLLLVQSGYSPGSKRALNRLSLPRTVPTTKMSHGEPSSPPT